MIVKKRDRRRRKVGGESGERRLQIHGGIEHEPLRFPPSGEVYRVVFVYGGRTGKEGKRLTGKELGEREEKVQLGGSEGVTRMKFRKRFRRNPSKTASDSVHGTPGGCCVDLQI